ncbi:MAG: DNA polymerase III epsilon subunit (EC [uncultured Thiotrichaceae bacterium]|uniref:DNA polymerase III subunit epsilon n=1 Tax=uncultured Thiotrichaceae bacterium TaxID=298394 RepID=A0A6S6UIZ0_9GAMM|nr:MAG: DNA polymerase III epsilon subunit (EC [uncultured Thiotrichaceae bacterium]
MTRQIVLDTETTGINPKEGHRMIEIGCVEMIERRVANNDFHEYLQPDREIEEEAIAVHGITNEFLVGKPRFTDVLDDFMNYIKGAELVIHNAPFDVGFLNNELKLANSSWGCIEDHCTVLDTLVMARKKYPGQRNSLDALCKRLDVSNAHRELHGALLDSQILADVYLAMTGGQKSLMLDSEVENNDDQTEVSAIRRLNADRGTLRVVQANAEEIAAHEERVKAITEAGGRCLWSS